LGLTDVGTSGPGGGSAVESVAACTPPADPAGASHHALRPHGPRPSRMWRPPPACWR